jgi:Rha family phage regulatory protein
MENLVFLKKDEALTDSLTVAEMFGKEHSKVMKAIENLIGGLAKSGDTQMFYKTWYKHHQNGERYPKYLMNRDGFSLLVMGFNGKKALEWKVKYIKAFNQMEKVIQEKTTLAWSETRQFGQITRKAECETLKRLVEYAKSQGSQHADKLYTVYSKLANTSSGIKNRDEATIRQLTTLDLIENIILHVVDMGIIGQRHYKEIYQDCKKQIETFKASAFIGESNGQTHLEERKSS